MNMTSFQREGLRLLGYSERESQFLFLVATHSGYFTLQQFKTFLPTTSGSVSHAFVEKLLNHRHASFGRYRSGERVYHIFARKLYQAIARENLRTRRRHELEYVKTRLVTLDFVLANPARRYLGTEGEKLDFFEKECGLSRAVLPVKLYRARKSAEVTPRYFVDRFPLFLDGTTLTFTYVDAEAVALDAFHTHLRSYLGLFDVLPAFEFIYLAPTARLFQAAQRAFAERVYRRSLQLNSISLLDYFRLRKAWDNQERVASADVIRLKEGQDRYPGKTVDALYERWIQGAAKENEVNAAGASPLGQQKVVFRTLICGASLKVFGPLSRKAKQIPLEPRTTELAGRLSRRSSAEGSTP